MRDCCSAERGRCETVVLPGGAGARSRFADRCRCETAVLMVSGIEVVALRLNAGCFGLGG